MRLRGRNLISKISEAFKEVRSLLNRKFPVFLNQIFNQLIFLCAGKVFFRLSVTWLEIILVLAGSAVLELAFAKIFSPAEKIRFPLTAFSTGFNYVFMLGVTDFIYYLPGLILGLLQKHIFRKLSGRHFQNPSNFAIVVTLLVYPANSFITVRDWGSTAVFTAVALFLGTFLLFRLELLIIPVAFFFFEIFFKSILLISDIGILLADFSGAAIILFSFFMITDPKTVPSSIRSRIIFAFMIALFDVLLHVFMGIKEINLFLSLLLAQLFVPLLRKFDAVGLVSRRLWLHSGIAAAGVIILGGVYFSSWNILKNLETSIIASRTYDIREATVSAHNQQAGAMLPAKIRMDSLKAAYKTAWTSSHMEKIPLAQPGSNSGKLHFQNISLPALTENLTAENLGDYAMLYSGVAVGDINHDGYPDVVINKLHRPLAVWLNNQGREFNDITAMVFPANAIPLDIEQAALADMNNDSYLDLVTVSSARYGTGEVAIHEFDPARAQFIRKHSFKVGRHASGGMAFHDLNKDRKLDFYISYGVNVFSPLLDMHLIAQPDALFVSQADGYKEAIASFFPKEYVSDGFAGMAAQFLDYDRDGQIDFLIGNDFDDPSIVFKGGKDGKFSIEDKNSLGFNTQLSMSFLSADFDNDGSEEIFEVGVSEKLVPYRTAFAHPEGSVQNSALDRDMAILHKSKEQGIFACDNVEAAISKIICRDYSYVYGALRNGNAELCGRVGSEQIRQSCRRLLQLTKNAFAAPSPARYKYDVEKFPKQLRENILWRRSENKFLNVLNDCPDSKFTGFSFAAFPFDINNDGWLDLYVTNGFLLRSHNENSLLINSKLSGDRICLTDQAAAAGVNLQKDGRGVVVADFDNDGDGDILVASYLQGADFFRNEIGGKSILVELRSRSDNYFALGSTIRLFYTGGIQTRFVTIGGIWGTSQPSTQHFGIPAGARIDHLEISWPNGKIDRRYNLQTGHKFIIYE
jgi:hypothetical protein